MSKEITYDTAADAEVINGHPEEVSEGVIKSPEPAIDAQLGCHSGSTMKTAAENNQNSEILEKYAEDYPMGPHDKPQSMCPAFGSLRVGLRMRRVATVLSGSACCVYGLTFVSHFYGARRSVGYVPFNSETLVTGKLFEDIRDAVHELADPDHYDAVVVTNLCVPTASGVPLRLLPNEINGVRIIGIDVPGFGVPTHAEAKDILAGAMLNFARQEVEAGPVQAPKGGKNNRPSITITQGKSMAKIDILVDKHQDGRMPWPEQISKGDRILVENAVVTVNWKGELVLKIDPLGFISKTDKEIVEYSDLMEFRARWNVVGKLIYKFDKRGIGRNGKQWHRKGIMIMDPSGSMKISGWANDWGTQYDMSQVGDLVLIANTGIDAWASQVRGDISRNSKIQIISSTR